MLYKVLEPVPEKVVTGTEVRRQNFGILKIYIGYRYHMGTGIGNFHFLWWYGNRYRKNSVPENILGTGIGKIWYRNRYRKNLVPKKVPVSVSKIFGTRNKYQYCLKFRVPSHTVGVVAPAQPAGVAPDQAA